MAAAARWSEWSSAAVLLAGSIAGAVALHVDAAAVEERAQDRSRQLALLREVVASRSPIEERDGVPIPAFAGLFAGLEVTCERTDRGVFLALRAADASQERP